jgi:hypothetical protein
MDHVLAHRRIDRRSPVLGVSGITLLMVVTMVLTGPALGRCHAASLGSGGGHEFATQRVAATDGAGHRLGGRRQMSSTQVRPVGGGIIIALARPAHTLASVRLIARFPSVVPTIGAGDRVDVRLLNLPPPALA